MRTGVIVVEREYFPVDFEKKWIHQNQPHLIQNLHLPIVVLHLQMLIILHLVLMQEQAIHLSLPLWLLEPLMLDKVSVEVFFC
ncbi:uncharacterized protein LOC106462164 isoform X4 [Limulus polyphemus]|uniref:Uncharacterized protein LOC106462164 isoform X4 n=1 Tax=Limulus polyphemus TaxID=6850 RepID=A0ABM1SN44_LIMPO|nr:uncharacterized protein LOC106462164 isoform X4 [Limulus polyphemus]